MRWQVGLTTSPPSPMTQVGERDPALALTHMQQHNLSVAQLQHKAHCLARKLLTSFLSAATALQALRPASDSPSSLPLATAPSKLPTSARKSNSPSPAPTFSSSSGDLLGGESDDIVMVEREEGALPSSALLLAKGRAGQDSGSLDLDLDLEGDETAGPDSAGGEAFAGSVAQLGVGLQFIVRAMRGGDVLALRGLLMAAMPALLRLQELAGEFGVRKHTT